MDIITKVNTYSYLIVHSGVYIIIIIMHTFSYIHIVITSKLYWIVVGIFR